MTSIVYEILPELLRNIAGGKLSHVVQYLLARGKDAGVNMTDEDPHPVILILVM